MQRIENNERAHDFEHHEHNNNYNREKILSVFRVFYIHAPSFLVVREDLVLACSVYVRKKFCRDGAHTVYE